MLAHSKPKPDFRSLFISTADSCPCGLKPTPDQMASLRLHRHENSARMELHYQATTVNLFLRNSLGG